MRRIILASAVIIAGSITAMPSQAQGGAFMWCAAWADNGVEKTYYYSAFFSAGAWEADRKALKFKSAVEDADDDLSATKVTATCMAPAEYDAAVATRNAAMKGAPGTVLSWAG